MRLVLLVILVPVLLLKGLLWVLFVPLTRVILWLADRAGLLRLPLLLLTVPVWLIGSWLDARGTGGRDLTGDVIRPTFTLPYAFHRGPWRVREDEDVRRTTLELGDAESPSTLEITIGGSFDDVRAKDELAARAIDRALNDEPLPNGMRWAGVRITSFVGGPFMCAYVVWKDGLPRGRVIHVLLRGDPSHEAAADAFVSSVMPEKPEEEDDEAAAASPTPV